MSEFSSIRLPVALHALASDAIVSDALDGEQFAARQVEFIKDLFGYVAYLRERSRATPVADAFLATFVNLLEALELNAPGEAQACAVQLQQIIPVIFPGSTAFANSIAPHAVTPAIETDGAE